MYSSKRVALAQDHSGENQCKSLSLFLVRSRKKLFKGLIYNLKTKNKFVYDFSLFTKLSFYNRGTLKILASIRRAKLIQIFSWHVIDQKGSAYTHCFMTVRTSHYCKQTSIGSKRAEKITEAVLSFMYL